jgi:probable F420-dependent oxidoreductase
MLDPFVSLAAVAAATTMLRLGTGICLLTEHDPIVTAKEVASLDLISNGRSEFGIGAGWNAEEMANHGTVFETRFRLMADRAKAIKAIWTNDEASYEGEFTRFERIWSWPKPVQKPHPPILLGGETKHTLRRVMDFCDGWFPRGQRGFDPQVGMQRLREAAKEAGRDIRTVSTTLFGAEPDAGYLERTRAAGMDRALFALPSEARGTVLPLLDKYAAFLR